MQSLVTRAFALAGLIMGIACVWEITQVGSAFESNPSIKVFWPTMDFGKTGIGQQTLLVRFQNTGHTICRVVGANQGCRRNVCFGPKYLEPVDIAPGATIDYSFELEITGHGTWECPITIFLEDGTLRQVTQTVRGCATNTK